jgi:putative lipase involved disintegration of autophagic bodies
MDTCQYRSAIDFVRSVPIRTGSRVSVCGHSLGGAIAQIVGSRLRLPFATFNAPGVGLISRNLGEVVRGANFRLSWDVVGLIGAHYGRVIDIPYTGGALDVGTKHRMGAMIAALETSSYRDMPIESVAA